MGIYNFIKPTSLTFTRKEHIVGDVYSFIFEFNEDLKWHAGQHGMLELTMPNSKTSRHMFSLSSAPAESVVTVTTHWRSEQASDYKKALWNLKAGDQAKIRGPVGPMYIRDYAAQNVLIAGGIGITPFRSIIKEASVNKHNLRATLLFANRDIDNIVFKKELDSLSDELSHVHIRYIIRPDKITEKDIRQASEDISHSVYYLSGPPKMIRAYKKLLTSMGISRSRIKSDPFMGYK